jgi:hypothetical protein
MKSTMLRAAFAVVLLVGAAPALAQKRGHPPLGQRGGFLIQTDADFGGEKLVTVDYEYFSQDLRAGQGLALSLGGWFRPIETSAFEIQASIGYKYDATFNDDADYSFSRTLLQLEGLYRWPSGFYAGAGYMRHMSPTFATDEFGDIEFDDANGVNVEAGWRWIGLHYNHIRYPIGQGVHINGDAVGIRFTWRPGERWW